MVLFLTGLHLSSLWRALSFYVILEESSVLKVQFGSFILSPHSVPSAEPETGLPVGLWQSLNPQELVI